MGGGSLLTLLIKNPHLKISGVILHNPFITFPSTPPVSVTFMDRLDIRIFPKKFEKFVFFGRMSVHDLGYGEKYFKKIYGDRKIVPLLNL